MLPNASWLVLGGWALFGLIVLGLGCLVRRLGGVRREQTDAWVGSLRP